MGLKRLALLFLLGACGPYQVEVTGGATVTYKVQLDLVQVYFEAYCKDKYPNDEQLQTACVDIEVANFIKMLEGK